MTQRRYVERPTIARNTSGFNRQEIMAALALAGKRPSGRLLLDLTKTRDGYKGWCHSIGDPGVLAVMWTHAGSEYVADCHIRARIGDPGRYKVRLVRGKVRWYEVNRWQALALLLAHEVAHWRQAVRDGKSRCLQLECDKQVLRVARRLGLKEASHDA